MDMPKAGTKSKAAMVRDLLTAKPRSKPSAIVDALKAQNTEVTEKYVSSVKWEMRHKKGKRKGTQSTGRPSEAKYPRHALEEALRIPRALLDQNAGKQCSIAECAKFIGVKATSGDFNVELSSAAKYGLIDKPSPGRVALGETARRILRPQDANQKVLALREAALKAPQIGDVYNHYRGENLPDAEFFANTLTDNFHVPLAKVEEFDRIFRDTLKTAGLLEEREGKWRVLDLSRAEGTDVIGAERIRKLGKDVQISSDDVCFVVMPFAQPYGGYYGLIYEPAIKKAGLKPIRADNEIFGTGKIMDQIWNGISTARVLVAELTTKNPNVFYELGLAHALKKPVVLVSANTPDVPFDLQHIRVIYYDVMDPFWGEKLQAKIAENIISAIKNPEEAIFRGKPPDDKR